MLRGVLRGPHRAYLQQDASHLLDLVEDVTVEHAYLHTRTGRVRVRLRVPYAHAHAHDHVHVRMHVWMHMCTILAHVQAHAHLVDHERLALLPLLERARRLPHVVRKPDVGGAPVRG